MTDQQLYLAIGLPIIANFGTMFLGFTLISSGLNKRVDDLRADLTTFRAETRSDLTALSARVELLTGKVYELMGSK